MNRFLTATRDPYVWKSRNSVVWKSDLGVLDIERCGRTVCIASNKYEYYRTLKGFIHVVTIRRTSVI